MLEQREFDGHWWLPSAPDRQVAGRLTFSPDAIALDLLGTFDDEPLRYFNDVTQLERHEVIHGMSRDQKAVTLSDCSSVGPTINNSAILASYRANRLYLGAWYDDAADTTFDEVAMRFTDLSIWAVTSGFDSKLRYKGIEVDGAIVDTISGIDVTFTPPDRIPVALGNGTTLNITFPFTWNGWQVGQTESHITLEAMFRLNFETPASFKHVQEHVYQLRNFVSFGIGRPVQIVSLTGFHKPGSVFSRTGPSLNSPTRDYERRSRRRARRPGRRTSPHTAYDDDEARCTTSAPAARRGRRVPGRLKARRGRSLRLRADRLPRGRSDDRTRPRSRLRCETCETCDAVRTPVRTSKATHTQSPCSEGQVRFLPGA